MTTVERRVRGSRMQDRQLDTQTDTNTHTNKQTDTCRQTHGRTNTAPDCTVWGVCRVGTYHPVAALNPAQSYGQIENVTRRV